MTSNNQDDLYRHDKDITHKPDPDRANNVDHVLIKRRMLPEWCLLFEQVLIALPHRDTDWAPRLEEINEFYRRMIDVLVKGGFSVQAVGPEDNGWPRFGENYEKFPYLTNDTWIRDYGPITVNDNGRHTRLLNFRFDGWGGKFPSERDNGFNATLPFPVCYEVRTHKDLTLEGGSIESDGRGTIMTTASCLMNPNRNGFTTEQQMMDTIGPWLGAERWIILHHGHIAGDDTDGHIDTLARFAPKDTILYVRNPDDPEMVLMEQELQAARTASGQPYRLIPLPSPDPILDEEGQPMPATYANFLVAPRAVIVPTYDQPDKDAQACEAIGSAFPDREVLTLDCRPLIWQHGSLHCATMQWPLLEM